YELHDLARARGVEGYRRMSKSELLEVVGEAPAGGPTAVERSVRAGLALLTLRGGTPENTLALETLEELAAAVEELSAGEDARLITAPVALRLFATCALVSMQEARAMGLVDDLGAPHRLLGRVEALLTRIERSDRVAVMATKRLLRPDTPREAHTAAFAALWD